MRVQDVMTEDVKTISPTTAAEDAWNLMRVNRIHQAVAAFTGGYRVTPRRSQRHTNSRVGTGTGPEPSRAAATLAIPSASRPCLV